MGACARLFQTAIRFLSASSGKHWWNWLGSTISCQHLITLKWMVLRSDKQDCGPVFEIPHGTKSKGWAQALPKVCFDIMNTVNMSMGFSPFVLKTGHSPHLLPLHCQALDRDSNENSTSTDCVHPKWHLECVGFNAGSKDIAGSPGKLGESTRSSISSGQLHVAGNGM